MKLSGGTSVQGTPEEVFDRLLDAELLARCIPGCERMEEVAPGVYETHVSAGVGAVKGSFEGRVTVSDVVRPERYRLSIEGKSPVGHVRGGATLRLEPTSGATRVSYEGDAHVAGLIASVGGRLIEGAAKKVVGRFFDKLVEEAARPAP